MAKKQLTMEEKLQAALVPVEEQPYKVPENWCWTRLGNVAMWGSGGTPSRKNPSFYQGDIPWIKTGELNEGVIYDTEEHISKEAVEKSSAKMFPVNTVIIAMYGATIGKVGIMGVPATTNQACACGVCSKGIEVTFLAKFLQSQKQNFIMKGKGGAQPNISQQIIKNHPIALPPMAEQSRIVARIESLFAKLDEAKEKIQEVLDGADLRRAAILHQAFTGKLTEKWRKENNVSFDSWEEKKLGDIGVLERGRSKHRPRNDPKLFGGSYPFIQTGDIAAAGMFITSHKQTLSDIGFQQSKLFPAGTLCITIAANIGDVSILSYDCCFPDSVVGFTPYEGIALSEYVYYLMTVIQQELEANAPATAQKNINLKVLNEVLITIPSIAEQQEIVRLLDSLLSREQSTATACEEALTTIDTLKKSILARAFRGELGTGDPADPDAKELLREILSA